MRKLLTALSSLAVLSGVMAATTMPAFAVETSSICTSFGAKMCIYSPNFNYGTSMTSSGSNSRTITFFGLIGETSTLQLTGSNAPANECLKSVQNTYNVEIGHCSDTGTQWLFQDNGDGTRSFTSVHYPSRHLASDNVSGDVVVAMPTGGSGWFYKWQPL